MLAYHRFFLGVAFATSLGGCASLDVGRINSAEAKPNNVWVFFTVQDGEEPVAGLTAEDFEIYEDDQLVSTFESRQTIQNPEIAAVMYTLLLLDVSGSITESGQSDALVDSAQKFVKRVEQTPQRVAVYAFDGGEDIQSVVPFTDSKASVDGGLEGLRTYKARDPSTNLNGAVAEGLETLRKALSKDKRPIKLGTLVVFSDGTDRAARVSEEELQEVLSDEKYEDYDIFAIGVGAELEQKALSAIGRDGTEMAEDSEKADAAFEAVAKRIEAQSKRFYLLSYCTPARAGEHKVRIDAIKKDEKGNAKNRGSLEYSFEAGGFGPPPECDPNRPPSFSLHKDLEIKEDEEPAKEPQGSKQNEGASKQKRFGAPSGPGGQ